MQASQAHPSPTDLTVATTLRARFPACDGACEAGRSHCACPAPAEACTDIGADQGLPPLSLLGTLAERFPRAFNTAAIAALIAMLGAAYQLDYPPGQPPAPDADAAAHEPRFVEAPEALTGFPPELLAEVRP